MRGSRNFRQGGPGQSDKKALMFFFFFLFFFLVLSLLYRNQIVNFKEIYHFLRFQRGSNIFQWGSNFFQGGSNCLFPIETHISCDFPGGSGPPVPPSGSALAVACSLAKLFLVFFDCMSYIEDLQHLLHVPLKLKYQIFKGQHNFFTTCSTNPIFKGQYNF